MFEKHRGLSSMFYSREATLSIDSIPIVQSLYKSQVGPFSLHTRAREGANEQASSKALSPGCELVSKATGRFCTRYGLSRIRFRMTGSKSIKLEIEGGSLHLFIFH